MAAKVFAPAGYSFPGTLKVDACNYFEAGSGKMRSSFDSKDA